MIPGKNTKEYVIVGAHFDHLGIDPALDGDQIYNARMTMLPVSRLYCRLPGHFLQADNNRSEM